MSHRRVFAGLACLLFVLCDSALAADEERSELSCAGGYAPSFRLTGAVRTPQTFDAAALATLPASRQTVDFFAGPSGLVSQTYVGVSLNDLLAKAGVIVDPSIKNDVLRKYVAVTGTDCYEIILSMGELRPDFGGAAQVLVAYATGDGSPLSTSEGAMRLVVPGDKKGGRYVSNIARIVVRAASE
jgi:DMSO/TMAO reductase YedYZ molybdopterin-dependent catalytic subunit